MALGPRHAAAVGEDGILYTWGGGAHGRLGHGDGGTRHKLPTPVAYFDGRKVVKASIGSVSGAAATAVVTEDGACFSWGAAHSALGLTARDGDEVRRPHPNASSHAIFHELPPPPLRTVTMSWPLAGRQPALAEGGRGRLAPRQGAQGRGGRPRPHACAAAVLAGGAAGAART